mmetsp:Transcript_72714/g.190616  ORF Transcript_72714/g.190616 Transcript_72714/m.190616 type:complete len:308 (-) Transcript_72714:1063-1986(-)
MIMLTVARLSSLVRSHSRFLLHDHAADHAVLARVPLQPEGDVHVLDHGVALHLLHAAARVPPDESRLHVVGRHLHLAAQHTREDAVVPDRGDLALVLAAGVAALPEGLHQLLVLLPEPRQGRQDLLARAGGRGLLRLRHRRDLAAPREPDLDVVALAVLRVGLEGRQVVDGHRGVQVRRAHLLELGVGVDLHDDAEQRLHQGFDRGLVPECVRLLGLLPDVQLLQQGGLLRALGLLVGGEGPAVRHLLLEVLDLADLLPELHDLALPLRGRATGSFDVDSCRRRRRRRQESTSKEPVARPRSGSARS